MEESAGPASGGLASDERGQPGPGPDHGGAAPPADPQPHQHLWDRLLNRQWVGKPCSTGPMRRGREDRLVAGVAACLAGRIGIDVIVIRIAFVVAGLLGGFGLAAYVVAWLLLPPSLERLTVAVSWGACALRPRGTLTVNIKSVSRRPGV